MKRIILISCISVLLLSVKAQSINHSIGLSVGFPIKFRFSIDYGININYDFVISDELELGLVPYSDFKIRFFSNRQGSSVLPKYKKLTNSHLVFGYGIKLAHKKENANRYESIIFNNQFSNNFLHHYRYSAGFGSTYILMTGITSGHKFGGFTYQKVGEFNMNFYDFYMSYYNDGGPVLNYFGDKEDRYWTGGLVVGYNFTTINDDDIRSYKKLEFSFSRFTGFGDKAFQIGNLLYLDKVMYDEEQASYNTAKVSLRYFDSNLNTGLSLNYWNPLLDLQDYLHIKVGDEAFHPKPEKRYLDMDIYYNLKL